MYLNKENIKKETDRDTVKSIYQKVFIIFSVDCVSEKIIVNIF